MNDQHENLIAELVSDNTGGYARVLSPARIGLIWLVAAVSLSALTMSVSQPFRSGWLEQILSTPLFAIEIAAGLTALLSLAIAMFRSAVPGQNRHFAYLGLGSLAIWLAVITSGLSSPILEPSMAGKRAQCYLEVFIYAGALALPALVLLRRRFSVTLTETAALAALWVGLAPAFLMQTACMYEVSHVLKHHVAPMLAAASLLTPVLHWQLQRRQ